MIARYLFKKINNMAMQCNNRMQVSSQNKNKQHNVLSSSSSKARRQQNTFYGVLKEIEIYKKFVKETANRDNKWKN